MVGNNPKPVTVNIKGDYPETRKVRPDFTSDGRTVLVMEKATDSTVGWSIDVSGLIKRSQNGKLLPIDVFRGERYPIEYEVQKGNTEERRKLMPVFSVDDYKKIGKFEIFKAEFGKLVDALNKLSPLLWVMLVLIIISAIMTGINIYMANGLANAVGKIPIPTATPTPPPHI
jgi:hypothetical protein